MLKRLTALALFGAMLSGCSAGTGESSLPIAQRNTTGATGPIPIYSPTPRPSANGLVGGLVGGLVNTVTGLLCGVTGGLTCHIVQGVGPQGLAASTPVTSLPGLHPADLQGAYAFPSATKGAGQTIGIVVAYDDPSVESDLGVYRAKFGLPACTTRNGCFKKIPMPGFLGLPPAGSQMWGQEASLDVQMASAVCPNCKLIVVEAQQASLSSMLAAAQKAVASGATVLSNSYGQSEFSGEASQDANYALGVPVVFGAGDSGAGAEFPSSSTHVISVGGTSLHRDSSPRGWSETVWAGTGGGCSAYIAKPAWQHDGGCANRTANDVAAYADPNPGVSVYDSYLSSGAGWRTYGGTSVAAPIVAAAIALAGNGAALQNAAPLYSAALNAVTSGSNGSCAGYLCNAGSGYSAPAGNGSPDGAL